MREPIHRPCSSLEVSYVSISKSSITLRYFNISVSLMKHVAKIKKRWHIQYYFFKKLIEILHNLTKSITLAPEIGRFSDKTVRIKR